jgi:hypothetical protein
MTDAIDDFRGLAELDSVRLQAVEIYAQGILHDVRAQIWIPFRFFRDGLLAL